jgi:hypothetical protein
MNVYRSKRLLLWTGCVIAAVAIALIGCKSKQDAAIEQAKQQAATTGQPQTVVTTDSNGNTVTTTVQPPAQGQTDQAVTTTVTPKPAATPAPASAPTGSDTAAAPAPTAAPAPEPAPVTPPSPPPPPPNITVKTGTALSIRIDQKISAKDNNPGDTFTGEVVTAVKGDDGQEAIPKGTRVTGVIDSAQGQGHFKGAADLSLRLTSLRLNGTRYPVETHHLRQEEKGKGKRTAGMVGGGAGLGLLIGGLAGGGKGAAIGGLVGAGAGTAGAGLTGNKDIVIQAETVVQFKLKQNLVLEPAS